MQINFWRFFDLYDSPFFVVSCVLAAWFSHNLPASSCAAHIWTYTTIRIIIIIISSSSSNINLSCVDAWNSLSNESASSVCGFITARSSYASAVVGIAIPSVCEPVYVCLVCLSHACFVTKRKNLMPLFWYHTKQQSLQFSDTHTGWGRRPLRFKICGQSDPPFLQNADFKQYLLITSQP